MSRLTRAACEDFLFHEAALLDEWRLDEWFALFAEGATYDVPSAGARDDSDAGRELFYIADDYHRLRHRVERLKKTTAHSEYPRSDTARLISNVRVMSASDSEAQVGCVFVTYRSKANTNDCYFGHHRYRLVAQGEAIRIAAKRSLLDMSSLVPQGRVSIIL